MIFDFEIEYHILKNDIQKIKEFNANGILMGFLKANGEIDTGSTLEIIAFAKPTEVKFHSAFDVCKNPLTAL